MDSQKQEDRPHDEASASLSGAHGSASAALADKIITAIEGHFRDWLMSGEHAEAKQLVAEILDCENEQLRRYCGCLEEQLDELGLKAAQRAAGLHEPNGPISHARERGHHSMKTPTESSVAETPAQGQMQGVAAVAGGFGDGEIVEAQDAVTLLWRPAMIERYAPYRGRDGWYIRWHDNPPSTESQGGWNFRVRRSSPNDRDVPTSRNGEQKQ